MKRIMSKTIKYCRWCGGSYTAARPLYKDGFCCQACKQAHHRAYKKYVTVKRQANTRTRRAQAGKK